MCDSDGCFLTDINFGNVGEPKGDWCLDRAAFDRIVRGGALTHAGMPVFADLTEAELDALQHYIRQRADAALAGD